MDFESINFKWSESFLKIGCEARQGGFFLLDNGYEEIMVIVCSVLFYYMKLSFYLCMSELLKG